MTNVFLPNSKGSGIKPWTVQRAGKWIEKLMHSANSTGGIQLVDEVIETPAD